MSTWRDRLISGEHCGRHPVDDLGEPWEETLPTTAGAHEALKALISELFAGSHRSYRDGSAPTGILPPEPGRPVVITGTTGDPDQL
jgi:hypothetical protein